MSPYPVNLNRSNLAAIYIFATWSVANAEEEGFGRVNPPPPILEISGKIFLKNYPNLIVTFYICSPSAEIVFLRSSLCRENCIAIVGLVDRDSCSVIRQRPVLRHG